MYEERDYRKWCASKKMHTCEIKVETSDLWIAADYIDEEEIINLVKSLRYKILEYSKSYPDFLTSLVPLKDLKPKDVFIKRMVKASKNAGVGPMASVAGGIAEFVGRYLSKKNSSVVVENGGDVFIKTDKDRKVQLFSGINSPFNGLIIKITNELSPIGVCTSSGRIGPSLSFGDADAACVLSRDVFLADAVATQVANMVKSDLDIEKAIGYARAIEGVEGVIVIRDEKVGAWGKIELVS